MQDLANGGLVHAESSLELDAFYRLEWDLDVLSFHEQAETIYYYDIDGKRHPHVPDVLVKRTGGREEFVEVKIKREAEKEENKIKFAARETVCRQVNRGYIVWTEDYIRKPPNLLDNLKFIYRYAFLTVPIQSWFEIKNALLNAHGCLPLGRLVDSMKSTDKKYRFPYVLSILWPRTHISLDPEVPLTDETVVRLVPINGGP